ncbi:MAG: efflux RND transporter periplasmic adaptor subunit [Thermodesulfobacteriota bacterium]
MSRKDSSSRLSLNVRKPLKWVMLLVVLGMGALALYQVWGFTQKRTSSQRVGLVEIPVQVSPVTRKDITHFLSATGDITPLMQVDLFPKVSGYLERIDVNIGDSVRQGQVVAQIDRADFLQKVKEAEAKVAYAKAQLSELLAGSRPEERRQAEEAVRQAQSRFDNAKRHRERVEALFQRQVISKKEMDAAEMEYTVAEAQLEASQQHLKLVKEGPRQEVREASQAKLKEMEAVLAQEKIRLQNTSILAPFSGEIVRRYVDAGALVSSSTPLVTLVHTETLKVVANVLERDIPLLKQGMKASVQIEAYPGKIFEGRIARINKALDVATRTLQVEIYIPNSNRLLKPGMFARLTVALSEKPKTLVILRNAVLEEGGSRFVFVIRGKAAFRTTVVTGFEEHPFVEVLQGVSEGDSIVVRGQESLKDRSVVRVIEGG